MAHVLSARFSLELTTFSLSVNFSLHYLTDVLEVVQAALHLLHMTMLMTFS